MSIWIHAIYSNDANEHLFLYVWCLQSAWCKEWREVLWSSVQLATPSRSQQPSPAAVYVGAVHETWPSCAGSVPSRARTPSTSSPTRGWSCVWRRRSTNVCRLWWVEIILYQSEHTRVSFYKMAEFVSTPCSVVTDCTVWSARRTVAP